MLTEKEYCNYETCIALKELGITYCGLHYYENNSPNILRDSRPSQCLTVRTAWALDRALAIPLHSAQKFLREEKRIEVVVLSENYVGSPYNVTIYDEDGEIGSGITLYNTYEDALAGGISLAVEFLKMEYHETMD